MKDIYINMNTQNILKYYGTKFDLKLDHSEFYDYELGNNEIDYNVDILSNEPIVYNSLKISESLGNFSCHKNTISLIEYDNRNNDSDYIYSGLTVTLPFNDFTSHFSEDYFYEILNNNVFLFEINGEIHYMKIRTYNEELYINPIMGNTSDEIINKFNNTEFLKCEGKLISGTTCCEIPPKLSVKPWSYQFLQLETNTCNTSIINRREESGWTLDFIFNRELLSWDNGGKFYYFGGLGDLMSVADNSLSFGFTSDGRIEWSTIRYSGYCDNVSGYTEMTYVETDSTEILTPINDTDDFNITITFKRNNTYIGCDLENEGGWNDLLGIVINDYQNTTVTAVTSTQITTFNNTEETLNKKWFNEREKRFGTLKIYLNGRPIYKKENWEEIVPSNRGHLPFIQSWGGTASSNLVHRGICCFNLKTIKYYEEPLNSLQIRHNFITRQNLFSFTTYNGNCNDNITAYNI